MQNGGHLPAPEGPKRPSSWGPGGTCEKVSAASLSPQAGPEGPSTPLQAGSTGEHPEGPGAPKTPSPAGTVREREPECAVAEDSQGLSSEEEEEEEEDDGAAGSILPPSVLDQASVIAERFGGSLSRRSSLALEGPGGRLASRSGSALSLDGIPHVDTAEPGGSRSSVPSPEPLAGARRESLLSSRDRLLLDKIKNYYGHAERGDGGFSVCRRESLSFIPKGLVRSSVSRLNGLPCPPVSPEPRIQPAEPTASPVVSPEEPCRENGVQPPEPLLILEEDDVGTMDVGTTDEGPPPQLLLTPPHPSTKVYQLARQYSLRIKSHRARARCALLQPDEAGDPCPRTPALAPPRDGGLAVPPSPAAPHSPSSPEPFAWPDVRELRARFGAPRPPPVSRSRSAPEGPCRGGRPAEKERGSGRSRSAEAGGGPSTPSPAPARHGSDGALWVAAEAPLGPGQRVLVLERLPPRPEPPTYVQIRSPTTREKICLKAVVERCKAYQASEEYRRRCPQPPDTPEPPEQPPRHGLVRDLRQKFQTLDTAS